MPESTTELLERTLARMRATEPLVHAYVHVDEGHARAAAKAADATASTGPLHGLPFAVKEVIEVAGIPTAGGCRVLKDHVPHEDATVVRRLRNAGAVLIGTQVAHELTFGLDEPPTRNPWNLECYPGGSSAGAGVSVAVGSASFALGTDAAGSVRIPAAMTGVVGMKPTAGLVSTCGVLRQASAPSIDNVGIVARRVAEVERVLASISGPDPADARTLHRVSGGDVDEQRDPLDIQDLKISVLGERTRASLEEIWVADADIGEAFGSACEQLQSAGARIVPIELPSLASAPSAVATLFSAELAVVHRDLLRERASDYHPEVYKVLSEAIDMPSSRIADAVRLRGRLCKEVSDAFSTAGVELLVTPTTPRVAMPLSTFHPAAELATLIPYTCGFNLTGQPAISIPCGFTPGGLPIGLQVVGLSHRDATVLRVARAYEQRNPWQEREPPIA